MRLDGNGVPLTRTQLAIVIKIWDRDAMGNWEGVVVVYDFNTAADPHIPTRAISFGTIPLSTANIAAVIARTGIDAVGGFVGENLPLAAGNNYSINIPRASLFAQSGAAPPEGGPVNIPINFHRLQTRVNSRNV